MRKRNSIINAFVALFVNAIVVVVNFILQSIFIKKLGVELLGLNSVFSNILTMLGVVELGFGSAIIFHLYQAVGDNNDETIASLMNFYKKVYNIIAIIVFILGIGLMPFLNLFIGDNNLTISIHIAFLLLLLDQVFSYLLSYKRSIIIALQKNYIIDTCHVGCILLSGAINYFVIIIFKNYYVYLVVKIVFRLIENLFISFEANHLCPCILKKKVKPLDKKIVHNLKKQVKGLLFHSFGTFMVNGTDNILLSKFFGLYISGLISNYVMITGTITTLLSQAINAMVGSIGNLVAENNKEHTYITFRRMLYLINFLYSYVSISIFYLSNLFIEIWLGKNYVINQYIILSICICFYSLGIKSFYMLFKKTSGIFYEDKYVPIIEAIVNICFSVCLLKIIGPSGIYIGTIVSHLSLYIFSFPKFLYKRLFNQNIKRYICDLAKNFALYVILFFITESIVNYCNLNANIFLQFILKGFLILIVNISVYIIFTFNYQEFKYYQNIIKNLFSFKHKNRIKNNNT